MDQGQIIGLVFVVLLIAGLALVVVFYSGELLASWDRMKRAREWQKWKRRMLRVPSQMIRRKK